MKVAVITGASGAIGRATAEKFIENGYFTVGQYRNGIDNIAEFKRALETRGLSEYFFPFKADFSIKGEAEKLAKFTLDNFGHADVLVSNAGADLYKLCAETTEEEWNYMFDVNVKPAFLLTKALLPSMEKRKSGSILFVSSIWGEKGACMETAYSASKASLIGFSKALSKEVATSGITVNCVCPGVIDTPMNDGFTSGEKADLIRRTPLGRFGTPQEIADLIFYLCTSASFITGQSITADGGFTL